jgi:16S rRNA (guanine527-N7)-methyltransferase
LATNTFFELIEADQRKAAFLMEAIRLTNAKAVVHARRIEETTIHPASLITSRALAPLSNLLELTLPLLTASGAALFLKGRKVEDEIEQASSSWTMVIERYTSVTDPGGTILKISGLVRA